MSRGIVQVFLATILLCILVLLQVVGVLPPAIDASRAAVVFFDRPLVYVFSGVKNFFAFFGNLSGIAKQNEILSRQVATLAAEVAKLENAGYENRLLRDALKFQTESNLTLIPGEVVGFDPLHADQKATLNRGSSDGVGVGDAVIVPGGVMAGVVSAVSRETSQMDLISSSAVVVGARTSTGGATGVVRGEHGLGLLLDLVSRDQKLERGERVVTSGLGGQYPANLLLGEVGEVRVSTGDLFQQASVVPAANLRNLRFVLIIRK